MNKNVVKTKDNFKLCLKEYKKKIKKRIKTIKIRTTLSFA